MSFRDPFCRHFAGYNDDILTSANAHVVIFLYLHFPQEASFQEGKVRDGNFYAETSAPAPGWAGDSAWLRGAAGWRCPGAGRGQRGGRRAQTPGRSPLTPAVRSHSSKGKRGTRITLGYSRAHIRPHQLQSDDFTGNQGIPYAGRCAPSLCLASEDATQNKFMALPTDTR